MRTSKSVKMLLLLAPLAGVVLVGTTASGSTPSDQGSALPPEKAQIQAVEQQWQDRLQANAADPEAKAAALAAKQADQAQRAQAMVAEVPAKWPEGIFANGEAPAPGSEFLGTNRWVGTLAGNSVAVYAGRAGENESTGRLMIQYARPDMGISSSRFVDLPGSGALRITSASGTTLTIADANLVRHTFDVVSSGWK